MQIVLPVRKGGLGNQMFQVAAGLVYGVETGKTVVIPKEQKHIHHTHSEGYEKSVFQGLAFQDVSIQEQEIHALIQNGFSLYPGEPGFEAWKPLPIEGNVILHGYFQYYPALENHKEFLSQFFLKNLEAYKKPGNPNAIGIHVRRGDYLKFSDVYTQLGPSYYCRAIKEMEERNPGKLYRIFSDDILWCREQDMFDSLSNVEFVDESNEIKCLCEMISCQGGFICANSTFSWWGAFLGAFQMKAPCIAPESWMKGFTGDLLPKEWIRIPNAKGKLTLHDFGILNLHNKKDVDNIVYPLNKDVDIFIDTEEYVESPNYKILFHLEPIAVQEKLSKWGNMEKFVIKNQNKYDCIVTYNQEILNQCKNAIKYTFPACSWISGAHFRAIDTNKKQFAISSITGSKDFAEGQVFRLLLYYNQQALNDFCKVPMRFYRSSADRPLPELGKDNNPFIHFDKFELFENYQYSFVIENSSQQNYFTEKLIDCLITKTIPIYYGCPNISEYFDTTGWIILTETIHEKRIVELIEKWQKGNYTKDSYQSFSQTIEMNYKKCLEHHTGYYSGLNKMLLSLPAFT